ncbi:MAG: xanthine dehydrogenase family protein molybdopterin-binding subunit [Bauldia sp.]|uniref:xanthine dehydrogenase family protein molybdopterin-binding subunit n=1 Tax=Bauldia sp. TaxID=2575872 RepID=UPI001E074174|nr:xanthine dehydrogenase family protein molybdopterin-binding subunit [Bauldia sp.]MCB1496759.1 xanthine dehydrogenase family protein molybdopterin-binding subunit [Bauldia sp.]
MNNVAPPKYGMGARAKRTEDKALVTGAGHFTDDYAPEGMLHAYVLRSSMAHARIKVGDLSAARETAGVRLVMTHEDLAGVKGLPCKGKIRQVDGTHPWIPEHPLLCGDMVRQVGDPIAFIVADTLEQAKMASETIEIDYDPLPAIADLRGALADDAPLVWPEHGTNVAFACSRGAKGATDAAMLRAARVSRIEIVNNRLVANYMETRGIVAEYDAEADRYTLTMGTQGGHGMRDRIAKDILGIPASKIRVITPDVGGGFGTKTFVYQEYPLATIAAKRAGKPVKWISERSEHFLVDSHGRDNFAVAEMAMDENGKFLAMRVDLLAGMGAYLSQFGPFIPEGELTMLTGVYDIPHLYALCRGIYTNTATVDAYRGAGRPEAAYLVERLVDQCGRDTGLGPVEIRRRNFIKPEAFPYETQGGRIYDSGEFDGHLEQALDTSDWKGFEDRAAASKAAGKLRGFGMATYVEACAFPGTEEATVRLEEDGTVTLLIGTQTNGQGHATAYSQFIVGQLGIDYDKVKVVQGDTDQVPNGEGTGGSRSIPLGAVSVHNAAVKLAEQVKRLASDQLEASVEDLELAEGMVRVAGTNRGVTLADVARSAKDPQALTAFDDDFEQPEPTYPNGSHIAEVEIDPETGTTEIVGYWIVDDFGATVNPMLLEGQVHGGIVQGIGQALYEHTVYDADGQLLSASFLDYAMPRADGVPSFNFETRNVPSKTNAFGIKGAGEAGSIGSCPAVMNAVVDALNRGCGITHIDMPATPERVWAAIQDAQA